MYELHLWNEIWMPGREMATIVTERSPEKGQVLGALQFPNTSVTKMAVVTDVYRISARTESPVRYAVIVTAE